jgi:DNA-binding response OmpR family regulator
MRILVVDDEKELADAIARGLNKQGYASDTAYDGEEALYKTELNSYDLIILDIMLPKIDGISICKKLRAAGSPVGILMLTARGEAKDRTNGLETGADDYLVKPFYFPELLARVRSILRRKGGHRDVILRNGDFVIDPNTIKGYNKNRETTFTVKEFAILEYLMQNCGRIVSQEELLEHIWDEESNMFTQAIKVHISNIRKKMEAIGAGDLIKTIKGKGYLI